jgi:acetyl-CoA synthetase
MTITEHPDGKVEKAGYWEVWNSAMRFGNVLRESGILKGDRVLVILPLGTDIYTVSIGIWALGGVVVHGTIMLRRAGREYRIGHFEVESAGDSHEAVLECAMIRSLDSVRGEIVKVFVVLKGGHEPSEKLIIDLYSILTIQVFSRCMKWAENKRQ